MPELNLESLKRCIEAFEKMKESAKLVGRAGREPMSKLLTEGFGSSCQLLHRYERKDPSVFEKRIAWLRMEIVFKTTSHQDILPCDRADFVLRQETECGAPSRKFLAVQYRANRDCWLLMAGAACNDPFFAELFEKLNIRFEETKELNEAVALSYIVMIRNAYSSEELVSGAREIADAARSLSSR